MWLDPKFCWQHVFLGQQNKKHLQELYGYAQDHITIIFVANGT